jgi:hypothetical protein
MKQVVAALLIAAGVFASRAAYAQAPDGAQAPADVVGAWAITTESPVGTSTNNMEIARDGDAIKAVAKSDNGDYPYDKAAITGNAITLVITIDYQGQPMTITYTGVVDGRKMAGDADSGGLAQGTWSAVRR